MSSLEDERKMADQKTNKQTMWIRAIPFEKLGGDVCVRNFQIVGGTHPLNRNFFHTTPPLPAESTYWPGLPPTCSFCLPSPIFINKYG